ncbi:MAG: tetratricopeptide repeat protein [Pseudomonadota bacterium]|nr:tetratricopeptide repeat protein [Pseudomonadota bacterium]
MKSLLLFTALSAVALSPAAAQRRQPTPEQRIDRLEKQVRQVQGRVFPKGQPADTAGFLDDPAATQASVGALIGRLDSVERQLSVMTRASEENGNRIAVMEAELAQLRADQDRRLREIESNAASADEAATTGSSDPLGETADPIPPASRPKVELPDEAPADTPDVDEPASTDPDAAGEAAYDRGFRLWTAGKHDQAITALNAMAKAHPDHRRVSWAHNLAGRAMLDKGQPRAAAEALLANYRRDPKGERAQDSLFYLGQALIKLGQPSQACKAFAELEDVYGTDLRAPLRKDLPAAKAQAKCG